MIGCVYFLVFHGLEWKLNRPPTHHPPNDVTLLVWQIKVRQSGACWRTKSVLSCPHGHTDTDATWESYSQLSSWRSHSLSDYSRSSQLPSHLFLSLFFLPLSLHRGELLTFLWKRKTLYLPRFLSLCSFASFAFTPPWWNQTHSPSLPLSLFFAFTINIVPLKHFFPPH